MNIALRKVWTLGMVTLVAVYLGACRLPLDINLTGLIQPVNINVNLDSTQAMYELSGQEPVKAGAVSLDNLTVVTRPQYTDYFVNLRITNSSSNTVTIKSGDFTLTVLDDGSQPPYFNYAAAESQGNAEFENLIKTLTLAPGESYEGVLWFTTNNGDANKTRLELRYGGKVMTFDRFIP